MLVAIFERLMFGDRVECAPVRVNIFPKYILPPYCVDTDFYHKLFFVFSLTINILTGYITGPGSQEYTFPLPPTPAHAL